MSSHLEKRRNLHQQIQANAERIETLEDELRNLQKLASIGTMACLAAHEFKNFLVPIINWAELALKNPGDNDLAAKALQKAVQQGNLAANILQRMLGFAQSHSDKPETVRVAELVDDCFQCLARDFHKDGITVEKRIDPDLVVEAYASQLQQVLLNLIINARHALLEQGGTLTIEAQALPDEQVAICVRDTGGGIDPAIIDRIFEPFFSTKGAADDHGDGGGTGLGLSVCRDIVEAHGGAITVASSPGRGAAFTLTIPAYCPEYCPAAVLSA